MVALCDHSIAHPAVLQYLVDHQGRLPANGQKGPMDRLWQDILADIEQSDHVLVNSDFVKETFVHQGWAPERVHVIYLGVDAAFLDAIPSRVNGAGREKNGVRLLFGGCFERRKGAEVLIQALLQLDDLPWRLEIAGPIADDIQRQYHSFLKGSRVEHKGLLSRKKLAEWMAEGGIFVFPSLAEGSARVVFEALACGCYPITTPNSGSIVEDGVHGRLIPAGDVEALAEAIRKALGDRGQLVEIGRRNAALVHTSYRQSDYGEKLITLYDRLVQK